MKLPANRVKEHKRLYDVLDHTTGELQEAITEFNEKMEELWNRLVEPKRALCEAAINDCKEWTEQAGEWIGQQIGRRSEKWQQTDEGQEASRHSSKVNAWDPPDVSIEALTKPGEVEPLDADFAVDFEALANEEQEE